MQELKGYRWPRTLEWGGREVLFIRTVEHLGEDSLKLLLPGEMEKMKKQLERVKKTILELTDGAVEKAVNEDEGKAWDGLISEINSSFGW